MSKKSRKRNRNLEHKSKDKLTFLECVKVLLVIGLTFAALGLPVYLIRTFLNFRLSYIFWYVVITFIAYKKGYFRPYDYNENDDDDDDGFYTDTDDASNNS